MLLALQYQQRFALLTQVVLHGSIVPTHAPFPMPILYLGSAFQLTNTLPLMIKPSAFVRGFGIPGGYSTRPVVLMGPEICRT